MSMVKQKIKKSLQWSVFFLVMPLCFALPVMAELPSSVSMGWEPWPPMEYMEDGILKGMETDLISAVVKNMGCAIKFKEMPWKRLLYSVETGRIDMVASASKTSEREQWAYFSDPYRQDKRVLFVLKGGSEKYKFTKMEDLIRPDFKIGINRGVSNGEVFDKFLENPEFIKQVKEVTSNEFNIKKLLAGRIQGFLYEEIPGIYEIRNLGALDKVEVHPMVISSGDIHVMFSKKTLTPEFVEKFNKSLAELKEDGRYKKIMDTYLK